LTRDAGTSAILDHRNADHEMSALTERGPRPIRLAFPAPNSTPEDARRELVTLAERARARLGPRRA
jgi:hypothetical protein